MLGALMRSGSPVIACLARVSLLARTITPLPRVVPVAHGETVADPAAEWR